MLPPRLVSATTPVGAVRVHGPRRAPRSYLPHGPAGAAALERGEADPGLLESLAELSPDHRAVIVLRYLLEYTPGEIAELLDLPRGTVNSRLRRGLDQLKDRTT